jgi:hypothetical protein
MSTKTVFPGACVVLLIMGLSSASFAQSSVGAGPLTSTLTDTEPVAGVLSLGRVKVAPGITVQQLGWDDNVFDEAETQSPKQDYIAEIQPDISMFSQLRFIRVSAYAGSPISYFQKYDSERAIGYDVRGRADILLSRVRPFFGYGETRTRTRPNGEVDTRVQKVDKEASGGVAFDLSPHAVVYGAAYQARHKFEQGFEEGVDLAAALTRDTYNYEGGLRTDLTPLLSIQVSGAYYEDRFPADATRNARGKSIVTTFRVAPEAVFTGVITASYHDIQFSDPGVTPFQNFQGSVAIAYPFFEIGRFSLVARRGVEYSFDALEAYYVDNSASLTYTHRLFGDVDAQGKASRSLFEYSARPTQPEHTDTIDLVGGSLGYNLRNRTRIGLNYEYARRRSPAFELRNYQRRRVYLSWLFAF